MKWLYIILFFIGLALFVFKPHKESLSMRKEELEKHHLSGKIRLAIFLSVVWFLVLFIVILEDTGEIITAMFYGSFPLLILWGIWWIIKGFKKDFEKEKGIDK